MFKDVDPSRWSAGAIETASADGIVIGYPDQTFRPEQPLSREEMAVIWERIKAKIDEVNPIAG